ncbi:MAG TPA: hypothetical protein VLS89_09035 [Candidatus Nanopelagicales bacterium]|nr:hypothetical protein [Candidatus Nanopelagicales bacterium]
MTQPETEKPPLEITTAWHPMLVALLETYLPGGWQLSPEFLLNRMPLRVDIVVLRRVDEPAGAIRKIHSIFDHLRPHTLIEHKGPTDELEPEDALALLSYGTQYMRLSGLLDPGELCLMVVCDRIPTSFVEQVKRHKGAFDPLGEGLWRGELAGFPLHGVETREACRRSPTERLLYAFSRAYLTDPEAILPLDPEEVGVYHSLYQQVEQFRRKRGAMAIKDYEAAQLSYEEVLEQMVERLPPEKRLRGLTAEEILKAIPPEVREQLAKKLEH